MRVQIIGRTELGLPNRWAVVDDDDSLVPQLNEYLAYLERIEKPPNTIRAQAYDLRAFLEFLVERELSVDEVNDEVLGKFIRWYRDPDPNVIALVDSAAARSRSTTNRALASIASLYRFLGSRGAQEIGAQGLRRLQASSREYRRPRRSVLDGVGNASHYQSGKRLGPRLPTTNMRLKVLSVQEVHEILRACRDRRDRLLIMLAFTTGMRIGQIRGLKHEDIDARRQIIRVEARNDNPNGARSKGGREAEIPISPQVSRLYVEYMHEEYGYIDSPYVFINFETLRPFTPSAADSVVQRLRRCSGIHRWSMHTLRHTFVTLSRRSGLPIDVISHLVTHASIATTVEMYSHLDVEDLRDALVHHGAWEELEA